MTIEFEAPVRIESEMNRREHWATRRARFGRQKHDLYCSWVGARAVAASRGLDARQLRPPLTITFVRIGPRRLDSDNLAGGFKAVRDQLADLLEVNDGDPRIEWRYEQRKGKPKEYGIHVRIESTEAISG